VVWNPKEATNWLVVRVSDLPTDDIGPQEKPEDESLMKRIDVFP
jgi:hypothetical protein